MATASSPSPATEYSIASLTVNVRHVFSDVEFSSFIEKYIPFISSEMGYFDFDASGVPAKKLKSMLGFIASLPNPSPGDVYVSEAQRESVQLFFSRKSLSLKGLNMIVGPPPSGFVNPTVPATKSPPTVEKAAKPSASGNPTGTKGSPMAAPKMGATRKAGAFAFDTRAKSEALVKTVESCMQETFDEVVRQVAEEAHAEGITLTITQEDQDLLFALVYEIQLNASAQSRGVPMTAPFLFPKFLLACKRRADDAKRLTPLTTELAHLFDGPAELELLKSSSKMKASDLKGAYVKDRVFELVKALIKAATLSDILGVEAEVHPGSKLRQMFRLSRLGSKFSCLGVFWSLLNKLEFVLTSDALARVAKGRLGQFEWTGEANAKKSRPWLSYAGTRIVLAELHCDPDQTTNAHYDVQKALAQIIPVQEGIRIWGVVGLKGHRHWLGNVTTDEQEWVLMQTSLGRTIGNRTRLEHAMAAKMVLAADRGEVVRFFAMASDESFKKIVCTLHPSYKFT